MGVLEDTVEGFQDRIGGGFRCKKIDAVSVCVFVCAGLYVLLLIMIRLLNDHST